MRTQPSSCFHSRIFDSTLARFSRDSFRGHIFRLFNPIIPFTAQMSSSKHLSPVTYNSRHSSTSHSSVYGHSPSHHGSNHRNYNLENMNRNPYYSQSVYHDSRSSSRPHSMAYPPHRHTSHPHHWNRHESRTHSGPSHEFRRYGGGHRHESRYNNDTYGVFRSSSSRDQSRRYISSETDKCEKSEEISSSSNSSQTNRSSDGTNSSSQPRWIVRSSSSSRNNYGRFSTAYTPRRIETKSQPEGLPLSPRSQPRLYCDLDGVLADFESKVHEVCGRTPREMSPPEMWGILSKVGNGTAEHGFYATLPWMSDGKLLWDGLLSRLAQAPGIHDMTVLSGLPRGQWARAQKHAWCTRMLGDCVTIYTCMAYQKSVYCLPGDILIDDNIRARDSWEASGGRFILHTSTAQTLSELDKMPEFCGQSP
eukprot:179742_1